MSFGAVVGTSLFGSVRRTAFWLTVCVLLSGACLFFVADASGFLLAFGTGALVVTTLAALWLVSITQPW